MEWPEILSNSGITPSVLVFFLAFIIILIYLFFFQQYLTAIFYKIAMKMILPKSLSIHFERFSFSMFTGQFTLHRVQIASQDFLINIGRIRATLYYWRPISSYLSDSEADYKDRFHAKLNAVSITFYNRKYSTDLVEEVTEKIKNGASASDITNLLRSKIDDPKPFPLSVIYRAILPFSFDIKAFSVTFGNEMLPSYCILHSDTVFGRYSIKARETSESHMKSISELQFTGFDFLVYPHQIEYPEIFAISMRDIQERSKKYHSVIKSEKVTVTMLTDMPGCYISDEVAELEQVKEQPRWIVDVQFNEETTIIYGPYTDKLRVSFMKFFLPFYFNNPVLYEPNNNRIKNLEVILTFMQKFTLKIPFVTAILSNESLAISGEEGSRIEVLSAQYPNTIDECKMTVSVEIKNPQISSSLGPENLISADLLNVEMGNFYKERWDDISQTSVFCKFENATIMLHPYHIDFLTQLGTDWASYYPFQTVPDTAQNFFPWSYYVVVDISPVTIKLLMEKSPEYSQVQNPNEHEHLDIKLAGMTFRMTAPFTEYQAEKKGVNFSVDLVQGGAEFVFPFNHMNKIRRGTDINNYLAFERLLIKGEYRWSSKPGGDASFPLTLKFTKANGLCDFSFIFSILDVIVNYTSGERKVPEKLKELYEKNKPQITPYKFHISVVLSIDSGTLKVPFQMYDTKNCAVATLSNMVLTVESVFPYFEVMLNIESIVANIPPCDFPYEVFYKEQIGEKEMNDAVGLIHMDGLSVELRYIAAKPGITTSSDINVTIGKLAGFALLPHILSGLEITTSFIHHWFSEDSRAVSNFDHWYFYFLRNISVSVSDITLYVDMGQLGILATLLPSGVSVLLDNLIDEDFHTHMYVVIPSIDVIHLIQEYDNGPLIPMFRTTLYLNLLRNGKFDGNKEDKIKQAELLRQFDKNLKRYPFLWSETPDLPENFFTNPEIFDPNAYKASLKEEIELSQALASNPFEGGVYTLEIPNINYKTKRLFCTPQQLSAWNYHFKVCRVYAHNFPGILTRDIENDVDPTLYTQEIKDKFSRVKMEMDICIPHNLVVNISPVTIPVLAALVEMMNYKSNSMLLDSYVRDMVSDFCAVEFYRQNNIGVLLPKITVNLIDQDFVLTACVDTIKLFLAKDLENMTKKMSVKIDEITLSASKFDSEKPDLTLKVPNIIIAMNNAKSNVNFDPITLDLKPGSPSLIGIMGSALKVELSGLPKPVFGKRMEDFISLLKNSPEYETEKKRLRETQFRLSNQFMNSDYCADITAMYTTAMAMDLMNFNIHFKNVGEPEQNLDEPPKYLNIKLPTFSVVFSDPQKDSFIKVVPYPISGEISGKTFALTAGIKSLTLETGPPILKFVEALKSIGDDNPLDTMIEDVNSEDEPTVKPKSSTKVFAHLLVNDVHIKFNEISIDLARAAAAITSNPYTETSKMLSVTASINDLALKVSDFFIANFKSFSICQRSESLEGAFRIEPIDIEFPITFVLDPIKNLEKALGFNILEQKTILTPRKRNSIIRESFKVDNGSPKQNPILKEILDSLCVTVLVEPITIKCILNETQDAIFQLPGISGLVSNEDSILTFFTFMHEPIISITNIFNVQVAPLLLHGSFNVEQLHLLVFLMLGQINFLGDGESVSQLVCLLNSILSQVEKKAIIEAKKKSERTISLKETKRPPKRSLNINFQFLMPQVSFSLAEISTTVGLEALFVNLELAENLSFEAQIQGFGIQVYEAQLMTEFYVSFMNNMLRFTISDPTINLSQPFFINITHIAQFAKAIQQRLKKQKRVKKLFKDINKSIAKAADSGAGKILNSLGFDVKTEDLHFPDLINQQFFFEIVNTSVSLTLAHSGECHLTIPSISLCVQTRISEQHKKTASAAVFAISDVTLVLDSAESSTTTGPSSDAFEPNMRSGNTNDDMSNNLSLVSLHQLELSIISFQNRILTDANISGLNVKLFPTFPSAIVRIIEVIDLGDSANSSAAGTTESEFEEEDEDEETKVDEADKPKTIKDLEIEAHFRCVDTEIVLNPIANTVPIPRVVLEFLLKQNHAYIVVNIPNDVKATLSPPLIDWIMKLLKTIKLRPNQQESKLNTTPKASKNTKAQPTPTSKKKSRREPKNIQPQSSAATLLLMKDNIDKKFKYDIIFNTKCFEICLSCKPRRSDISAVVGFSAVQLIHSSTNDSSNASIVNIYLRTHNIYTPTNSYARTARLFELTIPRIDASLILPDIPVVISKIEISISSDKIEEISLFNDVWVQPLLKVFNDEKDKTPDTSPKAPIPPIPANQPMPETDFNLKLLLNSIDLYFNYTSGAGNLLFKLYPIRAEISKELKFLTVDSISLNSFGRLTSDISIETLYIMKEQMSKKSSKILFIMGQLSTEMRSLEDQFLSITVGRINLITRSSLKKTGPYSILLASIDSPVISATAQTVPNLLSFYHTVADPIKIGVQRANRTTEPPKPKAVTALPVVAPPNSRLIFLTSGIKVELFRYYFKDTESIRLNIGGVNMSLGISSDTMERISRDLNFSFKPIVLGKMIMSSAKPQLREILKLPALTGDLDTVQIGLNGSMVHYDFVTNFDGLIEPTLTLTDYEFLVDLLKYAAKQLNMDNLASAQVNDKPKPKKIQYQFVPNKYSFNPGFKVGIGASLKPNVQWLLTQLGISDEHIIPASLFEGVSLGLEKLLVAINNQK